jgi:hypothetical protein
MKSLFVSLYPDSPHFETELELMADLLAEGHEVRVLRCTGQLVSCLANPPRLRSRCIQCISRVDRGLTAVRRPGLVVEEIEPAPVDPRLPRRFDSMEEVKTFELDGVNLGRGACATTCAIVHKDTQLDPHEHADVIYQQLSAAHQAYTAFLRAVEHNRPDRVYVFNGRFATCYPIVLACRARGIDFYTHERGASTQHYVVRKNTLPHDYDLIYQELVALWGDGGTEKERFAAEWYEARRRGAEISTVSFTKTQRKGLLPDGFHPGRRNVAVFNSTVEEYDAIVQAEFLYRDEVVGLARIAEAMQAHPEVRLYLRVHPNLRGIPREQNYQLREYAKLQRFPNVTVIWPESDIDTYALMEQSTLVLTFGSTMGAESAFWGKPSILAGRAPYERTGCCHLPESHDDLVRTLASDTPAPKGRASALPFAYWCGTHGIRYQRFQPTDLLYGTFEGRLIRPSVPARARSIALRLFGR